LEAAVGLAAGKFTAFAATHGLEPGSYRVIEPGEEATFLAPLPVELLPVSQEIILRLEAFGLHTLGAVGAISAPLLQDQFGFEGGRLWRLANGFDEEFLLPRPQREVVEAGLSFEEPVAGIEMMVTAARQLLSRLRLPLGGRAVRELTLEAEMASNRSWSRHVVLREAVSEDERLIFVLRSALQNAPPPQAIWNLSLRLSGLTGETARQMTLGPKGRLQEQLEEAIRHLKVRYGYSPIYRCVDVDPWSVVPEERQILVESDV
jgi:nucleotidyltransferase/DNA polymerase involved in DNA repair